MDPVQSWLDAKEVRRMAESLMAPPPEVDPTVIDAGYGDSFEGFAGSGQAEESPAVPAHAPPAQRAAVESSLAKAQQVAEGSGMLRPAPQQAQQPAGEAAPQGTAPPLSPDSPFQVSAHQDMTEEVPMARQVSPPGDGKSEPAAGQAPQPAPAEPVPAQKVPSFSRGISAEVESSGSRGPFLDRLHRFSASVRQGFGAQAMFLIDNDGQVILDEVGNAKLIQVARTLANASYTAHRQSAGSAAVGNLHVKISANSTLEVVPARSRYGLLVLGVIFPAPLGAERVRQLTGMLEEAVEPAG